MCPYSVFFLLAIMRLVSTSKEAMAPFAGECINQLNVILSRVYKNPTNPGFNHYLFESIAALVQNVCAVDSSAIDTFERLLFPAFQAILVEDVTGTTSLYICCVVEMCGGDVTYDVWYIAYM